MTDNQIWPSPSPFAVRVINLFLKLLISPSDATYSTLSIFPSSFSTANQRLLTKVHFLFFFVSRIRTWRRNHEGLFPLLSCQILMCVRSPSSFTSGNTKVLMLPRWNNFFAHIALHVSGMTSLSLSSP